jgi:hypothetical protein
MVHLPVRFRSVSGARRFRRTAGILAGLALLTGTLATPIAAATPPANDLSSNATPLTLGVSLNFDGTNATESATDPTTCSGSHGDYDGPFFGSVWFSYKAAKNDRTIYLSSPTIQGDAHDYLGITFIYALGAGGSTTLVDCTAFGNDTTWQPVGGTTYLIMEAGLSSSVTDDPGLSDKGGHGTITLFSTARNVSHYHYLDAFTYDDCGFKVVGTNENLGTFRLKPGHNNPTPFWFDNYEWHTITRNPANGKWFREDGQGAYKDVTITKVEGTVYTFVSHQTGQPYTLTDMYGHRVFFDRGNIVTTFQVDTLGDNDPSNDVFVDGSFQVLGIHGPHPMYVWDGNWCTDIVQPLLGN